MVPRKMRAIVAAVAAIFMFSDITAAMPIAPMNNDSGISPILVRGGRGGGGRGGFHGGGTRLPWRRRSRLPRRRRARWRLSWRGSSWRGLSWRRLSRRRLSGWPCGRHRRTWRLGARLWLAGRRSNRGRRRRRLPDGGGSRRLCHVAGASSGLMLVLQRRFTAFRFLGHLSVTTPFAAASAPSRSRFCARDQRRGFHQPGSR